MKTLISILICGISLIACDKCKDETKRFRAELYPAIQKTSNDWAKVSHVSSDMIFFGIGTKYFVCDATGQEELNSGPYEFYTDREIIIGNDTIPPKTNLIDNVIIAGNISLYKDPEAFYNSPQYLIQVNNQVLNLSEYYTFNFKGFTVSGVEIIDSTIVKIE